MKRSVNVNQYDYNSRPGHAVVEVVYLPENPKAVMLVSQLQGDRF
jgi:hypothetical protein